MLIDANWIILTSISIIFGHYSLFTLIFKKDFVSRFKKFDEEINKSLSTLLQEFYKKINFKIERKINPKKLIKFIEKYKGKIEVIEDFKNGFNNLEKTAKFTYVVFSLSVFSAFASIFDPSMTFYYSGNNNEQIPFHYLEISNVFFVIGFMGLFYFLWKHFTFTSNMVKVEMGVPVTEISE